MIKQWTPSASKSYLGLSFPTFQKRLVSGPCVSGYSAIFPSFPFFVFSFTHRNWVICTNYPFPPFTCPRDMSCIANFLLSKVRSVDSRMRMNEATVRIGSVKLAALFLQAACSPRTHWIMDNKTKHHPAHRQFF